MTNQTNRSSASNDDGAVNAMARLLADVANIQAFVASAPDRDPRSCDAIIGYDERGLPG